MRWSLNHLVRAAAAALLLIAPSASALHESDVGVVDWHKLLVGVPLVGTPVTAPTFHALDIDATTANADANATDTPLDSVILTATANNVLAALNPDDGAVGTWPSCFPAEG